MIEESMTKAQIAKDDGTIDKYSIEALTTFIKTLLADLGETYKRSNASQAKVLLGSIFPSGTAWNYNGGLNFTISPLYQAIRTFESNPINTCADERTRTSKLLTALVPKTSVSTISPHPLVEALIASDLTSSNIWKSSPLRRGIRG